MSPGELRRGRASRPCRALVRAGPDRRVADCGYAGWLAGSRGRQRGAALGAVARPRRDRRRLGPLAALAHPPVAGPARSRRLTAPAPFLSATAREGDLRLIRAPNGLLAGCAAGRDHDEVSHGKEKADNGLVTQVAPEWTIRALLRCEISSAAAAQNRRSGQRHGASTNKSSHVL